MNFILEVERVGLSFGGIKALDDISFRVGTGEIHGLIGPNGAGKSSCFNVVTGLYSPTHGSVRYRGEDISKMRAHERARLGIARTFQNIVLIGDATARENMVLGTAAGNSSSFWASGLGWRPATRAQSRSYDKVASIAGFVGITPVLDHRAGALPYGTRKKIEIGRALCADPQLLLLDEPAAGMNDRETAHLSELILKIRSDFGITVLIVEHHVGLIMSLADTITVLNVGRVIANGPPDEVQQVPAVVDAYLGRRAALNEEEHTGDLS